MDIKAIAVDLDNTLLRSDKTISEYTQDVLARVRRQGVLLFFATGRSKATAQDYINIIMPDGIVVSNGALVEYGGTCVTRHVISQHHALALAHRLNEQYGPVVGLETGGVWYTQNQQPESSAVYIKDFNDIITGDIERMSISNTGAGGYESFDFARYGARLLPSHGDPFLLISPVDADKYTGLCDMCRHTGLLPDQIAAFGDDFNDLMMIQKCGTGIAMRNAAPEVIAAAKGTCGTSDEDGVARWIEQRLFVC